MTENPKISIITPSFNSGRYIENAIQSLINQNYDKWEHIIMDGGSTDDTINILKKYPHIKWISEPDKSVYDAMNKGIKMARGEWLYFMGGDDTFFNNQILSSVLQKLKPNLQVIYGNVRNEKNGLWYSGVFDEKRILKENICHQGIFVRKDVFDITGLFDLKYKVLSDWDHNMKWLLNKNIKKSYSDINIACYGADGISSNVNDPLFHLDKRRNFLKYSTRNERSSFIKHFAFIEMKRSIVKMSPSLFRLAIKSYLKSC